MLVSGANISVGIQSCPAPLRAPLCASNRLARGMFGFLIRQIIIEIVSNIYIYIYIY